MEYLRPSYQTRTCSLSRSSGAIRGYLDQAECRHCLPPKDRQTDREGEPLLAALSASLCTSFRCGLRPPPRLRLQLHKAGFYRSVSILHLPHTSAPASLPLSQRLQSFRHCPERVSQYCAHLATHLSKTGAEENPATWMQTCIATSAACMHAATHGLQMPTRYSCTQALV